jgi:hypothetical protein
VLGPHRTLAISDAADQRKRQLHTWRRCARKRLTSKKCWRARGRGTKVILRLEMDIVGSNVGRQGGSKQRVVASIGLPILTLAGLRFCNLQSTEREFDFKLVPNLHANFQTLQRDTESSLLKQRKFGEFRHRRDRRRQLNICICASTDHHPRGSQLLFMIRQNLFM